MHEADCAAVDDMRDVKVVRDVRGGACPSSPACPACLQLSATHRRQARCGVDISRRAAEEAELQRVLAVQNV